MSSNILSQQAPILLYTGHNALIQSALDNQTRPILIADNRDDVVQQYTRTQATLVILDDIDDCSALREQISAPILMISNDLDKALGAGANDYVGTNLKLIQRRVNYLLETDSFSAYDHIPAMIHSLTPEGVLRYVNIHWQEVIGYQRDEVIGKPLATFLSESSRKILPRMIKNFWQSGTLRNLAYRYIKKNGDSLDVMVDSNLLSSNKNITVLRDISELKTAESSLRESHNELQSVLRALPDRVVVVNSGGEYVYIVSEGHNQYSAESNDLSGKSITEKVPPEIADKLLGLIERTLSDWQIQEIEYQQNIDANTMSFHVTASPLSKDEIILVIRDVSGQYHVENSLKDSEENYRRLFHNATDAIFAIDLTTGSILQSNPQATVMLGYSDDELLTMKIDEIEVDQISIINEDLVKTDSNDLMVETQYRHLNGTLIDVEINSRVILQDGTLILISFVRDISGHKNLLKEMEHQRNLAEALLDTANALNEAPNIDAVLDTILQSVSRIIHRDTANIMLIEDGIARIIRHLDYEKGGFAPDDIESIAIPLAEAGNLQWIVDNKTALCIDDTHNSPHFNWVDSTTSNFVQSLLTAPIITDGEVIGFINLDSNTLNNFNPEHEHQLMAFANQTAIAIQQSNLIEQLRDYTGQLETRVAHRTEELEDAKKQLADERNLLRLIIDTIPDSIYVKDRQSRFIMANKATIKHTSGIESEAEIIGKSDSDFFPDEAEEIIAQEQQIMETAIAERNRSVIYHNSDGSVGHLLITKAPLIDSDGTVNGLIGINHSITKLREAESRLEQIINSARCLLWSASVVSEDNPREFLWKYQVVNEEAAQVFLPIKKAGMSYTASWLDTIQESQQTKRDRKFTESIESGKHSYRLEYHMTSDEDQKYWLSEDVIIQKIAENHWYVVGVCTDISARKEAEEALRGLNEDLENRVEQRTTELRETNSALVAQIGEREKAEASERQQRIIAEALRDGVAKLATTLDRHTIFDHLLDTLKSIIPHDASNIMLIENRVASIVHSKGYGEDISGKRFNVDKMPDILELQETRVPGIIHDVRKFENWQDNEAQARSNMSVPIVLDDRVIGVINLDSWQPNNFSHVQTGWLIAFGEQVGLAIRNARYTAELKDMVQERTQELEFEQAQLKAILDGVTDGVTYTDMNRKTQYVNQALVDISGFTAEEWKAGLAPKGMNTAPEEHLVAVWDRILRWLETHTVWTGELEFKRKDGSIFDASMARTAVKNQEGEVVGVVTVLRDVSDEKLLEAQKARFITTAAHELRTPIANLKTRLFLMKRSPEKFMTHISVAETVVNLMQNLVEHMFDLSRFERGVIEVNKEAINLQAFLAEVIQFQEPLAERLEVTLKLEMPDEPVTLDADPFRLTQVITNLVGNALKYTPANQDIVVQVKIDGDNALIDVSDKGSGIPAEHLPNLFQPFYQVTNDNKGAGLGLAIVYEIVKAHGGDITVESEVDAGTTFCICLPLNKSEQS